MSLCPPLSNIKPLCQNDRSPVENDRSTPSCQNHEEEVKLLFEISPIPDPHSALVPCQSPSEEVIHITSPPETNNTN